LVIRLTTEQNECKPWAIFEVQKDLKYTDFDKVRLKIEALTDEIAGSKKGIVNDPIILTMYSNDCPDLTLIDLPGITRIPLKNSDQKENIEQITKDMALQYAHSYNYSPSQLHQRRAYYHPVRCPCERRHFHLGRSGPREED